MKERSNGFVWQAMFLSASGIIVRVIGVLYGIPLTNIIGDLGNGYYSSAYNIYSIILLVCSYSIPMAVSKIMSEKIALREYATAHRVFKCSLMYVSLVGGIACFVSLIFAPKLVDVPEAVLAMRILAPTIFFSGILSVLRGYFQAQNTMIPTAVSQIIEQLLNAVFSVSIAYLWVKIFTGNKDTVVAQYGAAGAAAGTGAGVIAGLLFAGFTYAVYYPIYKQRFLNRCKKQAVEYRQIFKVILYMVTPVILSTCIYNMSTVVDMKLFYKISSWKQDDINNTVRVFGIFSRKYLPLANVPIAIASSMVSALVPQISTSYVKREFAEVKNKIKNAVQVSMMFIIPAACGLAVLAKPIIILLYGNADNIAINLLRYGSIGIVFSGFSTVFNGVLQGTGKPHIPMKNAAIALVVQTGVLAVLMLSTELKVYALLVATTLYVIIISILNYREIRIVLGYRQELKKTFIIPLISAGFMCLCVVLVNFLLNYIIGNLGIGGRSKSAFEVVVSLVVAVIAYFSAFLLLGDGKEEIRKVPFLGKIFKV